MMEQPTSFLRNSRDGESEQAFLETLQPGQELAFQDGAEWVTATMKEVRQGLQGPMVAVEVHGQERLMLPAVLQRMQKEHGEGTLDVAA